MARPLRHMASAALTAALLVFTVTTAKALHAPIQNDPWSLRAGGDYLSFSLGASAGLVEGTAVEQAIYYPLGKKFKISELTWDLKDVVVAGLSGSVGIARRFQLNLGVWSALTEGTGMMIDRDWNFPDVVLSQMEPTDKNWSDESRHPDTTVDKGLVLDQSLSVLALRLGSFSLRGIIGYKYETWEWSSRGGSFVYSTLDYGSRDYVGSFTPGLQVISYEQRYSIPYAGLGICWAVPGVQIEVHALYSPLVSATDSDYHNLRGVLFEGEFDGGTYVAAGLGATWVIGTHWAAALGVEYQSIPEITGDVIVSGLEGYGYFPGGGGIGMDAFSFTLGFSYHF